MGKKQKLFRYKQLDTELDFKNLNREILYLHKWYRALGLCMCKSCCFFHFKVYINVYKRFVFKVKPRSVLRQIPLLFHMLQSV